MKKIVISIFFAALFALLCPSAAHADSNTAGAVIIDTPWTTLQTSIEALAGISGPNDVLSLTITASDILDGADINYICNMDNMVSFSTSATVYYNDNGDLSYGDVGDDFLYNQTSIESISMINATSFDMYAFANCTALSSVSLPNVISFGQYAFEECDSLISISLPNASTFGGMCHFCDLLQSADLPSAVSFEWNAFAGCPSLTSVNLPLAEDMGNNAFEGCASLQTISLPSAITFGTNALGVCPLLTSVSLPSAETFGYRPLYACLSLQSISLPNATTFGSAAFAQCPLLTSVSLPSAETFEDRAFYECIGLQSITLPNVVSFGDTAFEDCVALQEVNLPSTVSFGNDAFYGCLQPIDLSLGSTIPTVGSFSSGIPISGSRLFVPDGMITPYDSDLSGGPGEAAGDMLWYNWPLQITPAVNPQTDVRGGYKIFWVLPAAILIFAAWAIKAKKLAK